MTTKGVSVYFSDGGELSIPRTTSQIHFFSVKLRHCVIKIVPLKRSIFGTPNFSTPHKTPIFAFNLTKSHPHKKSNRSPKCSLKKELKSPKYLQYNSSHKTSKISPKRNNLLFPATIDFPIPNKNASNTPLYLNYCLDLRGFGGRL